ncbi:antibiotic biosynthesis monooxygenase [Alteromonas sediminis]|uniref:Antibiotic biosynthesis monooxygenase n=1 Tax=Alteromonas sediminis TaxID=2259342 RepID=A0A3N5Y045_9ALTE|nr:antibiotic biosynthesis monooxygenase [Alteromonas sediminis]RPJ66967.1 antibiotic biosynthesis monooxygenase [Alteromonas sediminis]
MFHVIYEWWVAKENIDNFIDVWRKATNRIHNTVDGAKGSFMIRSCNDSNKVVTIAKWRSRYAWEKFWLDADPKEMRQMRKIGERVSVEVFEELGDETV